MPSRVSNVLLVSLLAGLVPRPALAQPEDASDEPATDEQLAPEVEQAKQLFNEGATKFETADYAGAIELWTKAYGIVPNLPEYAAIKAKLIANLAAAQQRAYEVDKQVEHLNQAKILLDSYRAAIADIYPDADERGKELAWVDEQTGKIDAELQAVADREAAAQQHDQAPPTEPTHPGRGLIISGGVLTGLGAAGFGVMAAGMAIGSANNDISDLPTNDIDNRASRFKTGRLGNALAISGGVGGGVLFATGVALLVVGIRQKRGAQQGRARTMPLPMVGPYFTGLGVVGRF